jgi:hypothetical protein
MADIKNYYYAATGQEQPPRDIYEYMARAMQQLSNPGRQTFGYGIHSPSFGGGYTRTASELNKTRKS